MSQKHPQLSLNDFAHSDIRSSHHANYYLGLGVCWYLFEWWYSVQLVKTEQTEGLNETEDLWTADPTEGTPYIALTSSSSQYMGFLW